MIRGWLPAIAIGACGFAAPLGAQQSPPTAPPAGVRIGLNYGAGARPGVIVLPIEPNGDSLGTMIRRDLDYSDRLDVIALDSSSLRGLVGKTGKINYGLLSKFGASVLISGAQTAAGVRIVAYDVSARKLIRSANFALTPGEPDGEWRFSVHGVSDEIEEWLFGVRGISQSRIAFVHAGAIKLVDSDGAMTRVIRAGNGSLSPQWSFDGTRLVYCVLGDAGTSIWSSDLRTGVTRRISSISAGLNITPVFTPDGNAIVYSRGLSSGEGSDLVLVDQQGRSQRLTVGNGADNNSPSYNPDGRQLAFVSGRSGSPQVYIMDADGTNMELLTGYDFAIGSYRSSPDWAPDGRSIVYQQRQGDFQVWMIDLRTRVQRQLTTIGENEDPSWGPDGRHIVLTSTRGGDKQLWVLDTESGRFRQLTHSQGARLASWSPLLGRQTAPLATP